MNAKPFELEAVLPPALAGVVRHEERALARTPQSLNRVHWVGRDQWEAVAKQRSRSCRVWAGSLGDGVADLSVEIAVSQEERAVLNANW